MKLHLVICIRIDVYLYVYIRVIIYIYIHISHIINDVSVMIHIIIYYQLYLKSGELHKGCRRPQISKAKLFFSDSVAPNGSLLTTG